MDRNQLTKSFLKRHPLMEISPYNIAALAIEDDIFERISAEVVMDELPSERREKIAADLARIEAAGSAEEIAALFRKNLDIIVITNLIDKALEREEEVFPLLFKRYCTSSQTEMIEAAARFFGRSKHNYAERLLEAYDSIRDPYAQAQACVVIGLRGPEEAIPKMFSEYERLLGMEDETDHYSQAPLLALHELYDRFCAK